jgi:hypothetical protein
MRALQTSVSMAVIFMFFLLIAWILLNDWSDGPQN